MAYRMRMRRSTLAKLQKRLGGRRGMTVLRQKARSERFAYFRSEFAVMNTGQTGKKITAMRGVWWNKSKDQSYPLRFNIKCAYNIDCGTESSSSNAPWTWFFIARVAIRDWTASTITSADFWKRMYYPPYQVPTKIRKQSCRFIERRCVAPVQVAKTEQDARPEAILPYTWRWKGILRPYTGIVYGMYQGVHSASATTTYYETQAKVETMGEAQKPSGSDNIVSDLQLTSLTTSSVDMDPAGVWTEIT